MTRTNDAAAIGIVAGFFLITAVAWAASGGTATAGTPTGAEATILGVTPLAYLFVGGVLAGAAVYWIEPDKRTETKA
ncbi:MAG: hypothetical protein PPP58_01180 [Natronomonas sp.]